MERQEIRDLVEKVFDKMMRKNKNDPDDLTNEFHERKDEILDKAVYLWFDDEEWKDSIEHDKDTLESNISATYNFAMCQVMM